MTAFARLLRPVVLLVSLSPLACGGPPPEGEAPPAPEQGKQALTPPTVTISTCYMSGFGRPNFTCEGQVTGGTLPYNFFAWWNVANTTIGVMTFTGPNSTKVNGRCVAYQTAQVRFEVTDADGVTADAVYSFPCVP
ncbi:hypothetical protein MYSTI_00540 [Myxococcus stipitatus DSM 14675]|uniref:Ig-like domain-containing protein n=1 Tax=Myxococcus stipitatus (strain DSM 14675 / JCM 12634 / Mx s8) TaxID=1278073 RepID=L7U251_MYXSD|nr:hypothetical protein [Myxococcus stipitatus]AGC41890.1 hypothetical protein MYSTI_00540 [Myxococcus stipitatus DSM 14675]